MDRHHILYRTSEPIQRPLGLPGKAYLTWEEWYRDYLKDSLRVHGAALTMNHHEYACYRYTTRLKGLEGRDDQRSIWEREILLELMAELEGGIDEQSRHQ